MIITIGSGRKRQSIELPHITLRDRETNEKLAWNLKRILHERGVINNLG